MEVLASFACAGSVSTSAADVLPIENLRLMLLPELRFGGSSRSGGTLDIGMESNDSELVEATTAGWDPSIEETSSSNSSASSSSMDMRRRRRIEGSLASALLSKSTFPVMEIRIALGPVSDMHRDSGSGFRTPFPSMALPRSLFEVCPANVRRVFRCDPSWELFPEGRFGLTSNTLPSSSSSSEDNC